MAQDRDKAIDTTAQVNSQEVVTGSSTEGNADTSNLVKREVQDVSQIKPINILRGIFGLGVLIGIAWLFSSNRKKISLKPL